MAKEIYNETNTNLDGSDESVSVNTVSTLENDKTLLQYYNSTDTSVDVTINGSRSGDDGFSESVQLSTESLSSGGAGGFYVVDDPWESVEVALSFGASPASGGVTVHRMDDN